MSPTLAPSRCACLTELFMNTVQRVPRSTGESDSTAVPANAWTSVPIEAANVCRNEPQPDEHASLTAIESTTPLRIRRYFMSCPPMSMTLVTPGQTASAAR
jgi:hypothetical protein